MTARYATPPSMARRIGRPAAALAAVTAAGVLLAAGAIAYALSAGVVW